MNDVWVMILRTLLLYFVILFVFRLMGKREIGELSVFDLVVNIMIAEMAVMAIDDNGIFHNKCTCPDSFINDHSNLHRPIVAQKQKI